MLNQSAPSLPIMKSLLPVADFYCLAYFALFLLTMPTEMGATGCKTTEGKKCVFPFKFRGRLYYECTWEWSLDESRNGSAWCGTQKVSKLWDRDTWGDCEEGCPSNTGT